MTVNLHGISRESFDLIVDEEVSSRAAYEKKYVRPVKPGGESGVTVGIGYDLGYSSAATIRGDWGGKIPPAMVGALASVAGIKGDDAFAACRRIQGLVSIPWDAAIDVFSNVSIPKYMNEARRGLPGYDRLPPHCKGALLSLVYNRGASFQKKDDRYREMRGVRAAMISGNLEEIPGLLRSMARLWTTKSVRGVALRREHEAKLFEKGLRTAGERRELEDAPPNVQPVDPEVLKDPVLLEVQQRLKARRYPPGVLDGRWGSGTSGALSGFLNDRGLRLHLPTNLKQFHEIADEVRAELLEAETETQPDGTVGWFRPVSAARANADPEIVKELAPEVAPAKQNFFLALWGSIGATVTAIWTGVKDYVSSAWDWFTDNSDSGVITTIAEFVGKVPTVVWIILTAVVLGYIALNARASILKSTQSVQNGERQ